MIKNRKKNILLIFVFLLFIFFIPIKKTFAADCHWGLETGNCIKDIEQISPDGYCTEKKEGIGVGINSKCCCPVGYIKTEVETTSIKPSTPPVNEEPSKNQTPDLNPLGQLQVKIPGIDELIKKYPIKCDSENDKQSCQIPWIAIYIYAIYNYLLGIVGVLATITLMIGGVIWLTSAGNASKVSQAKGWITGSITGIIILLTSYILLYEINPNLIETKYISLETIEEIPPQEEKIEIKNGQVTKTKLSCKFFPPLNEEKCGEIKLIWPTNSKVISSGFMRNNKIDFHGGIDIGVSTGTPVKSATSGVVKIAEGPKTVERCAIVMIQTKNLYFTYLHLSRVDVKVGQQITAGQQIGLSGGEPGSLGSCKTTGPHLHFQIKKEYNWSGYCQEKTQRNFINPINCLP